MVLTENLSHQGILIATDYLSRSRPTASYGSYWKMNQFSCYILLSRAIFFDNNATITQCLFCDEVV